MKTKNIQKIIEAGIDESKSGNFTDALQIPTRKGFGEGLLLAGKDDDRVVALSADLTESTQVESFKKAYPNRYFEMGVAEQNMASVASGMAAMGKIPFITSYAMFSPGRNWEQIRTTIAYNNVPVKIVGCHAGVSVGPDGGTHQALEDVGLMRMISNMIVVVPADAIEAKKATLAIAKNNLPSYLRLFREKSPVITEEDSFFEIGKANIVYKSREGNLPSANFPQKKLGIIACGEMVARSLMCVKELENLGVEVGIMNLHTIKPLDKGGICEFVKKYKNILTVEEHQIAGGMGSSILEMLSSLDGQEKKEIWENLNFKTMGINDRFGQSGTKEELFNEYKISEKHIFINTKKLLNL